LPPGTYAIDYSVEDARFHHAAVVIAREKVTVENVSGWRVTEFPPVPDFEESNIPKPYGAPPARRRVV
jgi:hypothetical protein